MAKLKLIDCAVPDELNCYDYYKCTNCNFHIIVPKACADIIYNYKICPNCCNRIADVIRDESNIITMEYFKNNEKHFKKIALLEDATNHLEEILRDIILFFPIRITDEKQRKKWNNYVEKMFYYLDEDYSTEYQYPYLDTNKWYTYYREDFMTLEEAKEMLKEHLEYLDMVDKTI